MNFSEGNENNIRIIEVQCLLLNANYSKVSMRSLCPFSYDKEVKKIVRRDFQ